MYKRRLFIESLSKEEIRKSNVTIKKVSTQLDGILKSNEEIISSSDSGVLKNALDVLDTLIDKRATFIKKKESYDKKIVTTKKRVKKEFDKFDDKKKLTYILATVPNTFDYVVETFEEGYDEFLYIMAKRVVDNKEDVSSLIEKIDSSIQKATKEKYSIYIDKLEEITIKYNL